MKIIRNNIIPVKGFRAINLFGVLFVRKDVEVDQVLINHEKIHSAQMKELMYILFYAWYAIEWIIKLIKYKDVYEAYRKISFEKEAYDKQEDADYLDNRFVFTFLNYLI